VAITYLVTGGAGFIGANLVHYLRSARPEARVVVYDVLSYAGNLDNLEGALDSDRCCFVHEDIADGAAFARALERFAPDVVFNLAAESHVDRSIDGPAPFVQTNVVGTFTVLEATLAHWRSLAPGRRDRFRLLHVSTDEVYGTLGPTGRFEESTPYAPRSPYAASKAAADHLVSAYHHTYGLPVVTTNCSNNYGPYQFPEKLVPVVLLNAIDNEPLPVYGDGGNVRDWLYVRDHCTALLLCAERGRPGEAYNVGANQEKTTLEMVHAVCDALAEVAPRAAGSYRDLVTFVTDRPGHDRRYAIDAGKIRGELGWAPATSFEDGLRATVRWYLDHRDWCRRIHEGSHRRERLGLGRGTGG
jgi:dTDP-glucose 4,6-dehydratase